MENKRFTNDKIGNIALDIFSGGTPSTKKSEYWNGELHWLSSGETKNRIIINTEKKITQLAVEHSTTKLAKIDDIVIASAGQGRTRGQVSFCKIDTYINQSIIAIRCDKTKVEPLWLFYNLYNRYDDLRRVSDSHSSRGSLTTKLIRDFEVTLPPIELQQEALKLLGLMEDKILINTQVNNILIDMVLGLYRTWFMEFSPSMAKENQLKNNTDEAEMLSAVIGAISGLNGVELHDLKKDINPDAYDFLIRMAGLFPVIKSN